MSLRKKKQVGGQEESTTEIVTVFDSFDVSLSTRGRKAKSKSPEIHAEKPDTVQPAKPAQPQPSHPVSHTPVSHAPASHAPVSRVSHTASSLSSCYYPTTSMEQSSIESMPLTIAPVDCVEPIEIEQPVLTDDAQSIIASSIASDKKGDSQSNDFYLYYDLLKQATSKTNKTRLEGGELNELMKLIKHLDHEGHKIMYVLIRMYSLKTQNCKMSETPYGGKK